MEMIDDTSMEIIRCFQWPRGESSDLQSRPSIYKISKKLGIHPAMIKKRIDEMISMGLIRNIKYYIDDRYNAWNRYFLLINNKKEILNNISEMFQFLPFVERVIYGYLCDRNLTDIGFFCGISLICKNDSEVNSNLNALTSKLGIKGYYSLMKENDSKISQLDNIDISIVKSIIKQSPLTFNLNEIFEETKIPLRTVRRRVEKLLEIDAIYEEISFDTGKLEYGIMPSIILKTTPELNMNTLKSLCLLNKKYLIMKKFGDFMFIIYHVKNFNELEMLSAEFSKTTENFMISFRNGSLNNLYVKYF
jgi:DNA-binding Lrp family transcriptional regulator